MFMKLDAPFQAAYRQHVGGHDWNSLLRLAKTPLPLASPAAEHQSHNEDAILDLALCLILAATIVGLLMLHI